jgi:hypothetical protein
MFGVRGPCRLEWNAIPWATRRTIREVVVAKGVLTLAEAVEVLDPLRLTEPS